MYKFHEKVIALVKNIVFDMGGVIIDFNAKKMLEENFSPEYYEVLDKEVFHNEIWNLLDAGLERSEFAIPKILPKIPGPTHTKMAELLNDAYPYMKPYDNMYEFITRIKNAGYKVYLLSNATPRFFDRYLDIPALTLMDGYFISCVHKLLKPQPEIYKAFCDKFSVKPEECFFIDDMPQNIEGAKNAGMKGFVYKAPNTAELESALNAEGVTF